MVGAIGCATAIVLATLMCAVCVMSMPVVDVVVVGAGITGVTAARTIVDRSHTVAILEADNHYGGRVHTIYGPASFPYPVEMGGAWVHDQNVNPMYPLLVNAGIPMQLFNQGDSACYEDTVFQNGHKVGIWVNRAVTDWGKGDPYRQTGVSDDQALALGGFVYGVDREVDTTFQFFFEQWIGNNTKYHDSMMWDSRTDAELGPDHIVLSGYISVLDYLLDRAPAVRPFMQLNSVVTNINYQGSDGSAIVTYQQNGVPQQIKATKAVIVTVSINVLKHGDITFNPPIPAPQVNAMNKLMCSAVNKVALFFDAQGAALLSVNRLQHNYLFRIGQEPNLVTNDGLTCFINWQFVRGQAVLTSFYQGDFSAFMEQQTDAYIIQRHMMAIRDMIPTMPDPIYYYITRWGSNPYTRCSYTDFATGATAADMTQLGVPFGPTNNIFLAGEASNWPGQGTVYAGYMSALSAVQSIFPQ